MNVIDSVLSGIDGGRVLDVATYEGNFVQILMSNLKSYAGIVGIDIHARAIETARQNLAKENVQFRLMDAERLDFEAESFDTVTISASLHHLANIPGVLSEMKRVLKPAGQFILVEMHCDAQTEAELTSVYLHQWVAEVDTALGYQHHHTLARQEFVDYGSGLGLRNLACVDDRDTDSDPREPTRIEQLDGLIDRTMQRADNTNNFAAFRDRGEQLRQRLHQVGAQREPILMMVGEK